MQKIPFICLVDELFDSYEEAKLIADARNSHLKWNTIANTSSNVYDELCNSINNIICDNM